MYSRGLRSYGMLHGVVSSRNVGNHANVCDLRLLKECCLKFHSSGTLSRGDL